MLKISRNSNSLGYLFVGPAILFILCLSIYPMINAITISFLDKQGSFVGINNFVKAFYDPIFKESSINSIKFVVISVVMHMTLAMALALFFTQSMNYYYRLIVRTLVLMAWAVPPAIVATIWRIMYNPQLSFMKVIEKLFGGVNFEWALLAYPNTSLIGITIANIWFSLPLYMLMMMAALQTIPKEFYEAAKIDGANAIGRFLWITLPGIRNILITLATFDLIGSFVIFELSFIMTGGGPLTSSEVLPTYIYKVAFTRWDFNYGAAMSVIMFIALLTLSLLLNSLRRD